MSLANNQKRPLEVVGTSLTSVKSGTGGILGGTPAAMGLTGEYGVFGFDVRGRCERIRRRF